MVCPCRDAIHRVSMGTTAKMRRDESRLYKHNNMETNQPQKRPTGMTILLVLSFINACMNIFSSLISFLILPNISAMYENGQMEESLGPFYATMSEEMKQTMMDGMNMLSQIDTKYFLFLSILFVGSLIGVIRMFKWDKVGFHIYSIAQILILINASVYLYPLQQQSRFISDLLLTAIFILLYYLYFKRKEMPQNPQNLD